MWLKSSIAAPAPDATRPAGRLLLVKGPGLGALAAGETALDVVEAGHEVGDGVDDVVRAALAHARVGALPPASRSAGARAITSLRGRPISLPLMASPTVHMPELSPSSTPGTVSSTLTQAETGQTWRLITFCRHMYGYGRPAGTSLAQTVESGS